MNKTKTRLIALAAIGAVGAAVLSGCSGPAAASNKDVTLKWWAPNLMPTIPQDQAYYKTLTDKFTKETGIKVETTVNAWGDYYNKILGAISSGEGPDVMTSGTTWVSTLAPSGAFLQFNDADLKAIGGSGQFIPTAWNAAGGQTKGGTSMIPWVAGVTTMFYNTEMFKAAGITAPPKTWPEFVADAKKLTIDKNGDGKIDQWGFGYPGGFAQEWAHSMFAFGEQNGTSFFDAKGNPTLNGDGMVDAVDQFVQLMTTDKVLSPSDAELQGMSDVQQEFINGKIAMMFGSGSNTSFDVAGFKSYAAAQIPLNDPLTGKSVTTHIAGVDEAIFGNTKYKEQALEFMKFLVSEQTQLDMAKNIKGILPTNKAATANPAVNSDPVFKVNSEILANTAAGYPDNTGDGQAETVIGDAMKSLFAKAATQGTLSRAEIKATLDEANSQLKASK
jgi:multiple sugar transport system substrate-binding protein